MLIMKLNWKPKMQKIVACLAILAIMSGLLAVGRPRTANASDSGGTPATSLVLKIGSAGGSYNIVKTLTYADMYAMANVQQAYSYIDSMPAPVEDPALGVKLTDLLTSAKIDANSVEGFTFYSTDGYITDFTKSDLLETPRYYYPNIVKDWDSATKAADLPGATDGAVQVATILAVEDNWGRLEDPPDFSAMTGDAAFRLLFGQTDTHTPDASDSAKWVDEIDVTMLPSASVGLTSPTVGQTYHPGDTVSVAGTVYNLATATVTVTDLDGNNVFTASNLNTGGGSLATSFTLSSTAVTGRYTVTISAPSLGTPLAEKINVGQSVAGGPNAGLPDEIILSWTDDPDTTRTISWRTGSDTTQDEVEYLPAAGFNGSFTGAEEATAAENDLYPGSCHFEATIRGLSPGTGYVYRVGRDGAWSQPASFTTAVPSGDFSFLYMGDVQQGYGEWGDLLQVAAKENPGPKFALLGGDLVDDSTQDQWQQFFAAATPTFSQISLMPAAGNHDESTTAGAALFWNSFAVPQNGPDGYKEFYSFDYENAHIVVLDSNLLAAPGTDEFNTISAWLRNDLNGSSKTWKFVVLHYPPYEVYPDDHVANLQTNWAPIFEQCGVDVVFDGHQQVYARTSPMKAGQIQPDGDGIVYIMGNAGSKYLPCGPYYSYVVKELADVSNYEVVNIDGNTFTMTAKDANGQVIDSCEITKAIQSVSAVNGRVTVTLSAAPSTAPVPGDFAVTQSINGGIATSVTPTAISASGATVTLTVPQVGVTASDQSVVVSVSYKGGTAVAASAFIVSAASSGGGGGGGTAPASAAAVTSATGSATVAPGAGGTISLGSDATVSIPVGALNGATGVEVAIQQVSSPPSAPSGFLLLSSVYEFTVGGSAGYSFIKPVTLTFTFDPASLAPGDVPSIYYYDEATSQWVDLGGAVSGNTVSIAVDHFTKFAVLAKQSSVLPPAPAQAFSDVPASYWAYGAIGSLSGQGFISGYPDGTFRPDGRITRAEFVSILSRALKLASHSPTTPTFTDVTPVDWCYGSVETAIYAGIVKGLGSTFAPGDPITREQMAVMIVKAANIKATAAVIPFTDSAQVSAWAKDALAAVAKQGIMKGYPGGAFDPQGKATRAETAAVIAKILGYAIQSGVMP